MQELSRTGKTADICLLVTLGFALGRPELIVIGIEPDTASGLGIALAQVGQHVSFFAPALVAIGAVLSTRYFVAKREVC